ILNFVLMHRTLAHLGSQPDAQPVHWRRLAAGAAGGVALGLATMYVLGPKQLAVASGWVAAFALLALFADMIAKSNR
ncbi:MFS transporter, partial [Burkholderia pseudomallei]